MSPFLSLLWLLTVVALIVTDADAGSCQPITMLMTRTSGTRANLKNGTWSTPYGLSSVNGGSIQASLKYIITETIDTNDGYAECRRKNDVAYIHFYSVQVCNSDAALWWFNQRSSGYGNDPEAYNFGQFGHYQAFDGGKCNPENPFCDYLWGKNSEKIPKLGPFVGWQNISSDVRNPTSRAYWYSFPGECPLSQWGSKSKNCVAAQKSGACALAGQIPDGKRCTWNYRLLGQVVLDDLVGITAIVKNESTKETFANATEYCQAGKIEFERNRKTFDFVDGLDFWKQPLNETMNALRVDKLLEHYHDDPVNFPLPTEAELLAQNPRCFASTPNCYDAITNTETCTRDSEMICVPCDQVKGGCATVPIDVPPFPILPKVLLPLSLIGNFATQSSCTPPYLWMTIILTMLLYLSHH